MWGGSAESCAERQISPQLAADASLRFHRADKDPLLPTGLSLSHPLRSRNRQPALALPAERRMPRPLPLANVW